MSAECGMRSAEPRQIRVGGAFQPTPNPSQEGNWQWSVRMRYGLLPSWGGVRGGFVEDQPLCIEGESTGGNSLSHLALAKGPAHA